MSKPSANSTLYKLIEAGQLAHAALVAPLRERGLEPGDDAIVFALAKAGTTEAELAAELGVAAGQLDQRIARLIERDLLRRQAVGPQLVPGLVLTERGLRIRKALAEHWQELEEALLGELKKKHRSRFDATLARILDLLRF
jgi:DNA-binding MarR family transcriptional regulator